MAIAVEVTLNGTAHPSGRYVSWAPSPCTVRLTNADGQLGPVAVKLQNAANVTGKLQFRTAPAQAAASSLTLQLPANGSPVTCWVSGRFGSPSIADKDAAIEVRHGTPTAVVTTVSLMVRIRKNALKLTVDERRRFLSAFAVLNNTTFVSFLDMHTELTTSEAHGRPGFYPWHRAYLLDLERSLQAIDPSVALPYWRFDQAAQQLFTPEFLGGPAAGPWAALATSNPLAGWTTPSGHGIRRTWIPRGMGGFSPTTKANVISEKATLDTDSTYLPFWDPTEVDPHGSAHTSFGGDISDVATAPRDPLFFLLHCNVDRLWAKWQSQNRRFNVSSTSTYLPQGSGVADAASPKRIGQCALDTIWPWNGRTGNPRPATAPRTPFPNSVTTPAPGPTPTVASMIDWQGRTSNDARLGFDYDDVKYDGAP